MDYVTVFNIIRKVQVFWSVPPCNSSLSFMCELLFLSCWSEFFLLELLLFFVTFTVCVAYVAVWTNASCCPNDRSIFIVLFLLQLLRLLQLQHSRWAKVVTERIHKAVTKYEWKLYNPSTQQHVHGLGSGFIVNSCSFKSCHLCLAIGP